MTITKHIDIFSSSVRNGFSKTELNSYLESKGILSKESIDKAIQRMVFTGRLIKTSLGGYMRNTELRTSFVVYPTEEARHLYSELKERFPLLNFIVWDVSVLTPLMHHIPNIQMIHISVEKDGFMDVAETLETMTEKLVFRNPSKEELLHLGFGREYIVIKPLISQSPMEMVDGVCCPTLEKILVDILRDTEFYYLRGSESYHIYDSAISDYAINEKALMRYAGRRNATSEVVKMMKATKQ